MTNKPKAPNTGSEDASPFLKGGEFKREADQANNHFWQMFLSIAPRETAKMEKLHR